VSISFTIQATETASTKRPPSMSGGKRSTPAAKLTTVLCTPLDPVDPELRERLGIHTPHELLQTFCHGDYDILPGDLFTYGGKDYPVRSVAEWKWRGSTYRHVILEDTKA